MMTVRQILPPALAMSAIVLVSNLLVQFPINPLLTWGAFSYPVAYFVTDVCNRTSGPALARRDLGYVPRISMAAGTAELVASLRAKKSTFSSVSR